MIKNIKIIETLEANKDGFTLNLKSGELVNKGFAVGITHNIPLNDIETLYKNVNVADDVLKCVGGWIDQTNKDYFLDFVLVVNTKEQAETLSKVFKQIAYFNLNTMKEVRL